jgi:hypothetical protein
VLFKYAAALRIESFADLVYNGLGQHRTILRVGSPASVRRWQREKRSCYWMYQRAFSQSQRRAMAGETARKASAVNCAGLP